MIEQQVAERFRAAVADEPPLGFDTDEVIDRAIKRRKRALVTLGVAAATVVEVLVVVALSGGTTEAPAPAAGPGQQQQPAQPLTQPPIKLPPEVRDSGKFTSTWGRTLFLDQPVAKLDPDQELYVDNLLLTNPSKATGKVYLKSGDKLEVMSTLHPTERESNMHLQEARRFTADRPPTLAVECESGDCAAVSLRIAGVLVEDAG